MENQAPFTLSSAARHVGVTVAAIRYWLLIGLLKGEKVGGRWQIRLKDLEEANAKSLEQPSRGLGRGKRGRITSDTE